ncbi:MAG: LuxR C-terminal-related transcriptional regulator [Planctomycetaceae bacterium]
MRNDLSGSASVFSMRTLMVTTADADAVSDDAAAQPPGAGVKAAAAGVCGVCGTDLDRYSQWQQRRDQAREVFEQLSRREQEIAGLAAAGLSSRDCADRLRISVKTVEKHRLSAYRRLQVPGLAGLIRVFLESALPVPPGVPFSEDGADEVV